MTRLLQYHSHFSLPQVVCGSLLCAALLTRSTIPIVHAQETSSSAATLPQELTLSAIPPRLGDDLSLHAEPGQTIQTAIKVRNSSAAPPTIETLVEDFIVDSGGTQPIPVTQDTPNQWSLASWITLSPRRQVLQPNEVALVNVIIEVPKDALAGGRFAMLMHQPVQTTQLLGSASGVAQRVGTLLYFIVDGEIQEEAYITKVQAPALLENGPVPLSFTIDNKSDTHIRPVIEVKITDFFGTQMESLSLESKNIFPFTTRDFSTQWERYWGVGRYTITVTASYGTQGKVATAQTSFWLLPFKAIMAIGVSIGALLAMLIVIRHHRNASQNTQAQKIALLEKKIATLEHGTAHKYRDEDQ